MIFGTLNSPRHPNSSLLGREAILCFKAGDRSLPRRFSMLERYPIDTGQLERGTAAAFWLATITLDFGVPTTLARGS